MKHLAFIVNPRSGRDRVKAIEQSVQDFLDQEQYTFEIKFTEYAKHGTTLAKEAAVNEAHAVVAVGGDGSVNDIVKGLLGTATALAIIPMGSGNGMARTFSIPINVRAAIEIINKGHIIQMDVAYANELPFISNAGVAFDALISEKFAKSIRRGLPAYSWLVTKHMWLYKEWDWEIIIDGKKVNKRAFIINVANGRQFGYNFQIAPGASWTDGLLDVVIMKKFPKMLGGLIAWRLLRGTIISSKYVDHYAAKEVIISHPDLKLLQTDGDAYESPNKIHFRIEPGMQRVIVPEQVPKPSVL